MAGTIVSDTIQNGAGASTSTTNVINGCAKAWVTVNGTLSSGMTLASYGVSSVTYISSCLYQVSFSTAFTDANYSSAVSSSWDSGGNSYPMIANIANNGTYAPSTTSTYIVSRIYNNGSTGFLVNYLYAIFFR